MVGVAVGFNVDGAWVGRAVVGVPVVGTALGDCVGSCVGEVKGVPVVGDDDGVDVEGVEEVGMDVGVDVGFVVVGESEDTVGLDVVTVGDAVVIVGVDVGLVDGLNVGITTPMLLITLPVLYDMLNCTLSTSALVPVSVRTRSTTSTTNVSPSSCRPSGAFTIVPREAATIVKLLAVFAWAGASTFCG
jgi:hypothetical protein